MAEQAWFVDWYNRNEQRNFPLADTATREDTSGSVQLPNDFLVDLSWSVPIEAGPDPSLFHLHSLAVFSTGITLNFGYNGDIAAVATVPVTGFEAYSAFKLSGQGDFSTSKGAVVIGKVESLLDTLAGAYEWDAVGGLLSARTVIPSLEGVHKLVVKDAIGETKAELTGVINLLPGRNISFEVLASGDENDIRIDCIGDEDFLADCICNFDAAQANPIRTISGIGVAGNNFIIEGSSCIEIQQITNGIRLVNSCAEPCCGCDELEVIMTDIRAMKDDIATLESLASQLQAAIANATSVILASRTQN